MSRPPSEKSMLIRLFTVVLDEYLDARKRLDAILSQNMLMKPNKRRDTLQLEATVNDQRQALIDAYAAALGD